MPLAILFWIHTGFGTFLPCCSLVAYTLIGYFGYYCFGERVQGNIINNFSPRKAPWASLCMIVCVFAAFPMNFYPMRQVPSWLPQFTDARCFSSPVFVHWGQVQIGVFIRWAILMYRATFGCGANTSQAFHHFVVISLFSIFFWIQNLK